MPKHENLNLEQQYLTYLNLVGLKEDEMHPVQKQQIKDTFYAACGQMLVLLKHTVGPLSVPESMAAMDDLVAQVGKYFKPDMEDGK